jgi:hypothetical protein
MQRWTMDLDRALEIVNDGSMNAYCDYVHSRVFQSYGEYEFGFDDTYDEVAYAQAYVAVEMALDDESFEFVPDDPPRRVEGDLNS